MILRHYPLIGGNYRGKRSFYASLVVNSRISENDKKSSAAFVGILILYSSFLKKRNKKMIFKMKII